MSRFLWPALILGALGVAAYIALTVAASSAMRQEIDRTHAALTRTEFHCPSGSRVRVERWSKAGWMRFCARDGEKDGAWQAWERQRILISGSYSSGKKHGAWEYFNEDGSTQKILEYSNGVLRP